MLRSRRIARQAGKIRNFRKCEIDFATGARVIEMAYRFHEARGEFFGIDEAEEGDVRIQARDDRVRAVLLTILEHDPFGTAIPGQNT